MCEIITIITIIYHYCDYLRLFFEAAIISIIYYVCNYFDYFNYLLLFTII